MDSEQYSIKDLAELVAAVHYIKESVGRIEAGVAALNGDVDDLCRDTAVLMDWRNAHKETHHDLNDKIKRLSILYGAATAVAAIFGIKFGGNP